MRFQVQCLSILNKIHGWAVKVADGATMVRAGGLAVMVAGGLALGGCSQAKGVSGAEELLNEAQKAYDVADYTRAQSLLDSLKVAYPADIDVQKRGMALQPRVIEGATLLEISENDSLMVVEKLKADSLKKDLRWVKTPRMIEGYFTAAEGYNPDFMNNTGLQPRVSEIGEFYVVSSVNPGGIGHTTVTLSCGNRSAATPAVAYDGESNYRIGGSEVVTFSPAESDTIGKFAAENAASAMTLTFSGKSSRKLTLSAKQVKGIATCYTYACALNEARLLAVRRQKLEATLQVARNQMARLSESVPMESGAQN